MIWVDQLKETIPDYAKDTRLNIVCISRGICYWKYQTMDLDSKSTW